MVCWLVAASLFFYGWWNPVYVPLLLGSVLFNYGVGLLLGNAPTAGPRRLLLAVGVAGNLGLLGYFKYANFFVDNVAQFADIGWSPGEIILPLAISFFTFQQIAYLVDASRGQAREYDFLNYCLFVTFFPQLIAGPIVHHKEMMPQFGTGVMGRLSAENLAIGLTIFAIGLFKKVMLADTLALYATPVFDIADAGKQVGFLAAWQGVLAYTGQIYFDFSGYSDMAIGLGRMFGIRLPLNFNSPYKSTSIIEFWRRWHMTLSRFLRDYLYIPLGGGRSGPPRRYVNLMIVMLLGGLWHGAGWTFVIWGGLHGSYLLVNHLWRSMHRRMSGSPAAPDAVATALSRWFTLLAIMVAWVFFRATNLEGASIMLAGMAGMNGIELPGHVVDLLGAPAIEQMLRPDLAELVSAEGFALSLGLLLFALAAPNTQQFMRRYRPAFELSRHADSQPFSGMAWRPSRTYATFVALIALTSLLNLSRISEFLYFQF
ncbi:MAG: MBOAT family protein [Rhodospirillales bacterium]|nr:MBOAT family protein [Rhodospirillales bacterium]MDH3916911.1 MBOAT family protein [Rhodospirillales bacterium]MDH3968867.1 MBOAT family protein [Rhodospirillales bacterium]